MLPTKLACFMCFSFLWFGVGGFILLLGIASKDALSYRSAAIDKIVRENFTSDNLKEVLSTWAVFFLDSQRSNGPLSCSRIGLRKPVLLGLHSAT